MHLSGFIARYANFVFGLVMSMIEWRGYRLEILFIIINVIVPFLFNFKKKRNKENAAKKFYFVILSLRFIYSLSILKFLNV